MSTPTTIGALKADFREQIKSISPSHAEYQSYPWKYVGNKRDVMGGELRTFHLQFGSGRSTQLGVQSPEGGEWEVELRVWASYAGLAEDDDDAIVTQDGMDLWKTINDRFNVLDGFYSATYEGFDEDIDEGGRRYVAHTFTVIYLQSTVLA